MHEQAMHWIEDFCLGEVQDELFKLVKEKKW